MRRSSAVKAASVLCGIVLVARASVPTAAQQPATPVIPNQAGKIVTVLGAMDPAALGQTLMHEHIFIEFQDPRRLPPTFASAEAAAQWNKPLTLATLSRQRHGMRVKGANFLGDFDESYEEVMEFKKWGGKAIVDVTNIGLGRDPRALVNMAHATGLSIVMGAGWYRKAFHPLNMDQLTVEELTDGIVRDIAVGVDGTGVRSGIIGEIGVDGAPLTPNEIKSIRASARASRLTGAAMTFHFGGVREEKLKVLDIVASEGADLSRVVMGHSSNIAADFTLMKRIMDRGTVLEFDYLGVIDGPGGSQGGTMGTRNDKTVARAIVELAKAGYADRIVLSHDICTKPQLKKYGGMGYSYISEWFLPELRTMGVSEEHIARIMVETPRRILTFAAPKPAQTTAR